MPTTWFDLSNEIRQMIVDYCIATSYFDRRTKLRFVPGEEWQDIIWVHKDQDVGKDVTFDYWNDGDRSRSELDELEELRSTYEDECKFDPCDFQAHLELLQVNKNFLTAAAVQTAILKHTTIHLVNQDDSDLWKLHSRIGRAGFAQIRRLHLTLNNRSQLWYLEMLAAYQDEMEHLEYVSASGAAICRSSIPLGCSLHSLRYNENLALGSHIWLLDTLLDLLNEFEDDEENRQALMWFIAPETESHFERSISFEGVVHNPVHFEYDPFHSRAFLVYSSVDKCCTVLNAPSVIVPQRISEHHTTIWPPLAAINDVPLGHRVVEEEET